MTTGNDEVPAGVAKPAKAPIRRLCSLSIHDASSSSEDIMVDTSLFPAGSVCSGDIMKLVAVEGFEKRKSGAAEDFHNDADGSKLAAEFGEEGGTAPSDVNDSQSYDHLLGSERSNIFVAEGMSQEMLSKHPHLQVRSTPERARKG